MFKDLDHSIQLKLLGKEKHLLSLYNRLNIRNPQLSIQKGYSLVFNENKHLVNSIETINIDDNLYIKVKDGIIKTKVLKIKEDKIG